MAEKVSLKSVLFTRENLLPDFSLLPAYNKIYRAPISEEAHNFQNSIVLS